MTADPGCEFGCGGLLGGQAGDCVDDCGGLFVALKPTGVAGDLNGLAGMRKYDPGYYRDDLDTALLDSAVGAGGAGVCGWDIFPGRALSWPSKPGWFP